MQVCKGVHCDLRSLRRLDGIHRRREMVGGEVVLWDDKVL